MNINVLAEILYFFKAETSPHLNTYPAVCCLVHWLHQLLLHSLKNEMENMTQNIHHSFYTL